MQHIIPEKMLLRIYQDNRDRLDKLTIHGSLTAWINYAIAEQLDRDENMEERRPDVSPSLPAVVLHTAPAEKPDSDFWGDEAYEKTKAALRQLRR